MKRAAVVSSLMVLTGLLGPVTSVEALEVIDRASAIAAPVHGFFDHEDLVPVPILNVSLAYTETLLEPGPATKALASFLWDPEAAALGTIICVLSGNQICGLPEYPFVARATYPSSGTSAEAPTISIAGPNEALWLRGAYEAAQARPDGALAEADVARLVAVPMDAAERRAVRSFARMARPLGAQTGMRRSWVIGMEAVSSRSSISNRDGVLATARSSVKRLELLGGLITIRNVQGEAESRIENDLGGLADAELVGLHVAGYEARIGRDGIRIDDQELGASESAALNQALNDVLSQVGMNFSRGEERVRRTPEGFVSEAWAFSLDFRRQVVPDQFPEGTQGPDVVRVPIGYARAETARGVVEGIPPTVGSPAPAAFSPGDVPSLDGNIGPFVPGLPPAVSVTEEPEQRVLAQEPVAGIRSLGVPPWVVIAAILIGLVFCVGLVSLRVAQVIRE